MIVLFHALKRKEERTGDEDRVQKPRFWAFLMILVLFMAALTGCSNRAKDDKKDDALLLGFSQLGSESGWRIGNTISVQDAAQAAGVRLMLENANQSQEKQLTALRSFIAYRVDVIAFSPIVQDGWDNVLREAKEAGIPVIIEDRTVVTKDESLYAVHVGSDFYSEGVMAGEYLLKKLSTLPPETVLNVVELTGTQGSSPMLLRSAGFHDTVAKEPRIRILDSVSGDFMISKGKECVRLMLEKYGSDFDVLFSHNDAMMYGALDAFGEYGVTPGKDVIVISVDGEQEAIDLLKEGKVNCVVECTPMLGEAIMQIAKDLVDGKPVEREIYSSERAFTEFDDLSQLAPRGY